MTTKRKTDGERYKAGAQVNVRSKGGSYSEVELERGLQALAFFSGNSRRAAAQLKEIGHPIPRTTLQHWKHSQADRYGRACEAIRDRVWLDMTHEWKGLARQSVEAAEEAVAKTRTLLREGQIAKASQAASAARNLGTVGGISNDKSAVIDGKPTEIRSAEQPLGEIMRSIATRFPGVVTFAPELLEATAEEIPTEMAADDADPDTKSRSDA